MSEMLTFQDLRDANLRRVGDFDTGGLDGWSPAEWGNALAGETGELCNVLKKMIRRLADDPSQDDLLEMAKEEAADVATYLDLVCARLGIDLADAITRKFNVVSVKIGSSVRLLDQSGGHKV